MSLDLTLDVISDLAALAKFEVEWTALTEGVQASTPFQSPLWQLTWWLHFGSGQLHVLLFRSQNRLVGVVPCFIHHWQGRKQMTLIGSGISDYLEPPIEPAFEASVITALQCHLETFAGWDVCDWQDLSFGTPLGNLSCSPRLNIEAASDTECSFLPLTGSFDEYWRSRSSDLRRNVRRYRAKAEAAGFVEFAVANTATDELVSALVRLHGERWRRHGQPGMIRSNHSAEFINDVAKRFSQEGSLRIFSLRFDGVISALIIGFLHQNQFFSYMSAFDPEHESFGFGRTLLFQTIQHLWSARVCRFDFLRGDEAYKQSWGAQKIPKVRITVTRK